MPTALVVDDEPLVRDLVTMALEQDGISVLTAGNGLDAIQVSHSHRGAIDLLVSDVSMPLMDGCTLANQLQAENPALPVLLISGYCESETRERCGQFPLLPKPFSVTSLLHLVHVLLNNPIRSLSPQVPAQSGKPSE